MKEEEVKDEREVEQGSGSGSGSNGEQGDGGSSNAGGSGSDSGSPRNESGASTGSDKGNGSGAKRDRSEARRNILDAARNKTNKGNPATPNAEHRDVETPIQGTSGHNERGNVDDAGHNRAKHRATVTDDRSIGQASGSSRSVDDNRTSSETSGIKIKVPPMPLASPESRRPTEVKWEDVLTKKESNDLKPRLVDAMLVIFTYMDKGIGATTRDKAFAEVMIWSSISKEECEVIATSILESGQRSKIVATVTRKVTRDYTKMQMGIILLPRLIMTFNQFYQHGFALPFGGMNNGTMLPS